MREKLERSIQLLFSGIFFIFIIVTVALFILDKPISYDFHKGQSFLNWNSYLFLILISALLLFVIVRVFFKSKLVENKFLNNKWFHIALVLLAAAIPRIIWINVISVKPVNDFELYHQIASNLTTGKVTANQYIALFPHVFGYPAVLSILYRIFGIHVYVAQVFNVLLGCGIAVLLYILGKKLLNAWSGLIASLIWCFWPSQIFYSCFVSSEALFTFIELLGIVLAVYILEQRKSLVRSFVMFALLGVYIALENTIRPFGIVFVLALLIYSIFIWRPEYKKFFIKPCLIITFLLSYYLMSHITGFALSRVINTKVAGFPVGFNIYVGSNIQSNGAWNIDDSLVLQNYMQNTNMTSQEIHNELLKKGVQRFIDQKTSNISLLKEKHMIMWEVDNDNIQYVMTGLNLDGCSKFVYLKYKMIFNKLCNLYYYMIMLLCTLIVPVIYKRKHNNYMIFILIIFCGIIAAHMLLEVAGRYHYPIISIFALICGYSLVAVNKSKQM